MSEPETVPQKTRRSNMMPRPTDGDLQRDKLKNKDPDRDYVFVDPRLEQFGTADYQSKGYVVETRRAGGVAPVIANNEVAEGSEIRQMGCVLMSRPKAIGKKEYADQQAYADAIDERILKPGGIDSLRGVTGYTGFRNSSSALEKDEA